jgi:hypothetical protein
MDKDGVTSVHDKSRPDTLTATHTDPATGKVSQQPFSLLDSTDHHERVEKALLDAGHSYAEAHRMATEVEHARIRQLGFDPNEIEQKQQPYIDRAAHRARALGNTTPRATAEPYLDSGENAMRRQGAEPDPRFVLDRDGTKYTEPVHGRLLGNVETVTAKHPDGSYAVMDPNSGAVLAKGKTRREADAEAAEYAANKGRVILKNKFGKEPPLSQQQLRERFKGRYPEARIGVRRRDTGGDQSTFAPQRSSPEQSAPRNDAIRAGLRSRLVSALGQRGIANLENQGLLNIHAGTDTLPSHLRAQGEKDPGIKAIYDPNTRTGHLIASRIGAGEEVPAVLHEIGAHHGIAEMLGPEGEARFLNDLAAIRHAPEVAEAWQRTRMLYPHLPEESLDFVREVAARLAETAHDLPIVRRLIAQVRAWLYQRGITGALDEDAVRALAAHALRKEMRRTNASAYRGQPRGALAARSERTKVDYEMRIDELFANGAPRLPGVRILDRSDVLSMLGHDDSPVHLAEGKVKAGISNHHLSAADWKQIPDWLEKPVAIFNSDTVPGRLVFIAPETKGKAPVLMIVDPGDKGGAELHLLVNAYDKDSGKMPLQRWAEDGMLRYVDQKQSPVWSGRSGLRLPRLPDFSRGFSARVYTDRDLVKFRATELAKATVARLSNPSTPENTPTADESVQQAPIYELPETSIVENRLATEPSNKAVRSRGAEPSQSEQAVTIQPARILQEKQGTIGANRPNFQAGISEESPPGVPRRPTLKLGDRRPKSDSDAAIADRQTDKPK